MSAGAGSAGFDPVPEMMGDDPTHRRILARAINRITAGKVNVTLDVTLTTGASTTISDSRLSSRSFVACAPLNAAAAVSQNAVWVSRLGNGSADLSHPTSAAADRRFRMLILG